MDLDDTICYCFHIPKRKIVNFIRITQPRRASQISECGGAGSGCGWCVPFLKKFFAEGSGETVDGAANKELTPQEYARQRGDYISDGGGTPPAGAIPPPTP
ncbi:MAG: (2Fe-2S)-binding protein [Planctomycetota bacterium]|nr:(2Fe-2S)-binding protein [Planctomycetota bacterium]MEC9009997.1 (2Fe-2S)-binding protein [Planctomycetota bacterium]MED5446707.1 (2Fe-2S)-binding protein [Planctomycetota bacterium]MEE3285538.1 (2Fe-2S)-binding protein [Planctomycetota bacterium]MEE3364462.1 (2Fe-2S)-binding protein [Planctomycetota bacterium]